MLFGCCANMQAEDSWGVGYGRIASLARLGMDYVELPLAQMTNMPEKDFQEKVLDALEENGIPCHACNNFFPASIRLTGPERDEDLIRGYGEKALGRAAVLGVKVVVLGSSGARNLPPGFGWEQGTVQMAENLRILAPIADRLGICIALEPLNRIESNILNTYREGFDLAEKAAEPNVGVLVDAYHFNVGNEDTDALRTYAPLHVHVAQTLERRVPVGPDDPLLALFFEALLQRGYKDRISLEGFTTGDYEEEMGRALAYVRGMCAV